MLVIGFTKNQFGVIVPLGNKYVFYKKLYTQYSFSQEKNKSYKIVGNINLSVLSNYPFITFINFFKAGQIVQMNNPDLISIVLSDPPFY